jgi:hypothetical protein
VLSIIINQISYQESSDIMLSINGLSSKSRFCRTRGFSLDIFVIVMNPQRYGYIYSNKQVPFTYDHRLRNIGHPVRSAIHKPQIGRLVVGWVTTSEYLLLYVFCFVFALEKYPEQSVVRGHVFASFLLPDLGLRCSATSFSSENLEDPITGNSADIQ